MRFLILSLSVLVAGCGQDVRRSSSVIDVLGVIRTRCPPGFYQRLYVFGLCINNTTSHTVRSVKVLYQRLEPQRWTGPGSLAPRGWKPEERWIAVQRLYANCVVPPDTRICLISRPGVDWITQVRITSIELGEAPFTPPLPPLFQMATDQVTSENPNTDPLLLWVKIDERHRQLYKQFEREDPEALLKILTQEEFWVEATIASELDQSSLEQLVSETDSDDWRGRDWGFVELPIEVSLASDMAHQAMQTPGGVKDR